MIRKTLFQAPYPFEQSTTEKIQSVLFLSLFLSLLLFLLQPFGFVAFSRLQFLSGYLSITMITFLVNYLGIPYFFPQYFEDFCYSLQGVQEQEHTQKIINYLWVVLGDAIVRHDLELLPGRRIHQLAGY